MTGSKDVIGALLQAHDAAIEVYCWLHDEEHYWEAEGFDHLEAWFDELSRAVWKQVHHKILKRIYKLGGQPPGVVADPGEALAKTLRLLQGLHDAVQAVYTAADADSDHVTSDKLDDVQGTVERWMVSAEKRLAQLARLKPGDGQTPWMAEQL